MGEGSKSRRTWLPMALWTAAIVAGLALVWGGASVYATLRETRRVLDELRNHADYWHAEDVVPVFYSGEPASAVAQLGGQEKAARKVLLHRRLGWVLAGHSSHDMETAILGHCGKAGVPALINGLKSKDPDRCQESAYWLAMAGKQSPQEAVAALTRLLNRSGGCILWEAVSSLGELGPHAKAALPALERLRGRAGLERNELMLIDESIKKIRGGSDEKA